MTCSTFLKPKLYLDREPYSRNKASQFPSRVVILISFMLSLSAFQKYKNLSRFPGKNVIFFTSKSLSGNSYFAPEHTQELSTF
jgi:hypothetical protein